jgi:hypothetical protein
MGGREGAASPFVLIGTVDQESCTRKLLALFTAVGYTKRPSASSHPSKCSPGITLLDLCWGYSKVEGGRDINCWTRLGFSEDGKGAARRMYLRWEMGQEKGGR